MHQVNMYVIASVILFDILNNLINAKIVLHKAINQSYLGNNYRI